MKKSNLIVGIVYLLAGLACLAAVLFTETRLVGILCGFAGAGIGPGCFLIGRYAYWASPRREKAYQEKVRQEQIELHDEMKEKLRDKSGRYAYLLGLVIVAVSMPVICVLDSLQIIEGGMVVVGCLAAYLIVQYIAGIVIYKHLLKKYE